MPGRSTGELAPLEQHDICAAKARQMVCDATTDNPAADNDDVNAVRDISRIEIRVP